MRVCLTGLVVVTLLSACSASEPEPFPGTSPPLGSGPYAHLAFASCKPAAVCPGTTCPQNAAGKEDSVGLDMSTCPTLDLTWNGGSGTVSYGVADLAVYLQRVEGIVRVEASSNAKAEDYRLVGFIGGTQAGAPSDSCAADLQGNKALINFFKCSADYIANVSFVRFTVVGDGTKAPVIDAVELLHYSPFGQT